MDIAADARDEFIFLALPFARSDAVDFDHDGDAASMARHAIEDIEIRDTALPGERWAPVQIGRPRFRLLPIRRGTEGFVCLGVAQILERRADGSVVLHRDYLAPSLRVGAAPALQTLVQDILGLLHQRGEVLAQRLAHPGRGGVAENAEVLNLQAINRHEPVFAHFAAQPSLHPEVLYRAMLSLAEARAVASFVQQPGCPEHATGALSPETLDRICRGECYNPSDQRRRITRIEVVRIRPQTARGEDVAGLVEDPWRVLRCDPDPAGCAVRFEHPDFLASGRDAVYYVRAIEEPTETINARNLRCEFDADGTCVKVNPCYGDDYKTPAGDDCTAPSEERAWASPIFVAR